MAGGEGEAKPDMRRPPEPECPCWSSAPPTPPGVCVAKINKWWRWSRRRERRVAREPRMLWSVVWLGLAVPEKFSHSWMGLPLSFRARERVLSTSHRLTRALSQILPTVVVAHAAVFPAFPGRFKWRPPPKKKHISSIKEVAYPHQKNR